MTTATMEKQMVIVDTAKNHRAWEIRGKAVNGKTYLGGKELVEIERGEGGLVVIVTRNDKKEFFESHCYPRIPLHKNIRRYQLDGYWGSRDRIVRLRNFHYNLSRREVKSGDAMTALCAALEQDAVLLPALVSGTFTIEILMNTAGECQCIVTVSKGAVHVGQEPEKLSPAMGFPGATLEDMDLVVIQAPPVVESPAPTPEKAVAAGNATPMFPGFAEFLAAQKQPRMKMRDRLRGMNRTHKTI